MSSSFTFQPSIFRGSFCGTGRSLGRGGTSMCEAESRTSTPIIGSRHKGHRSSAGLDVGPVGMPPEVQGVVLDVTIQLFLLCSLLLLSLNEAWHRKYLSGTHTGMSDPSVANHAGPSPQSKDEDIPSLRPSMSAKSSASADESIVTGIRICLCFQEVFFRDLSLVVSVATSRWPWRKVLLIMTLTPKEKQKNGKKTKTKTIMSGDVRRYSHEKFKGTPPMLHPVKKKNALLRGYEPSLCVG